MITSTTPATKTAPSLLMTETYQTAASPARIRQRVTQALRTHKRLKRSFVVDDGVEGFVVAGETQAAGVRFEFKPHDAGTHRVTVTFDLADKAIASSLLDRLEPIMRHEFVLELLARVDALQSPAILPWPRPCLVA